MSLAIGQRGNSKNVTKLLVLSALSTVQRTGEGRFFWDATSDMKETTEMEQSWGLTMSIVEASGLRYGQVHRALLRCKKAEYVQHMGRFKLVEGSAILWRITPRGTRWLAWARQNVQVDGVRGQTDETNSVAD